MKKFLLLALLALAPAFHQASAKPINVFDKLAVCTFYATKATEDTIFAQVDDKNEKAYTKFVAIDALRTSHSHAIQKSLIDIGAVAWKYRHHQPSIVGMLVYGACIRQGVVAPQQKQAKKKKKGFPV